MSETHSSVATSKTVAALMCCIKLMKLIISSWIQRTGLQYLIYWGLKKIFYVEFELPGKCDNSLDSYYV